MTPQSPLPRKHRSEADSNLALARQLVDQAPGWSLVIAFYAALHYLGEYAAYRNDRVEDHSDRAAWITTCPELRPIAADYDLLRNDSSTVRYECPPKSNRVLQASHVRGTVIPLVVSMRDHVDKLKQAHGWF